MIPNATELLNALCINHTLHRDLSMSKARFQFLNPQASFAEQNEPCVTDKRQQRIVILRAASQRLNHFADDCRVAHGQLFLLRANKQCAIQAAIEASYSSVTLKVICSPRCSGQDAV